MVLLKKSKILKRVSILWVLTQTRKVLNLVRGNSDMYEVTPSKGEAFQVLKSHYDAKSNKYWFLY